MNTTNQIIKSINALHSNIGSIQVTTMDALEDLDDDIAEARDALQRAKRKRNVYSGENADSIKEWRNNVIRIGELLTEHRADYGKGWRADYESHGFEFGYSMAYRYISCSKHPAIGEWAHSVDKWAESVSSLMRSTEQIPMCRVRGKSKEISIEDFHRDESERREFDASLSADRKSRELSKVQAMSVDEVWKCVDVMLRDNPYWIALKEAIESGWTPKVCSQDQTTHNSNNDKKS